MYHLFGGDNDNGQGMDGYAGIYETIEDAAEHVVQKKWDWADLAREVDGKLALIATWGTRRNNTQFHIRESGWLMADASFAVMKSHDTSPRTSEFILFFGGTDNQAIASIDHPMASGSVWPGGFVHPDDGDDE